MQYCLELHILSNKTHLLRITYFSHSKSVCAGLHSSEIAKIKLLPDATYEEIIILY